MRWVDRHRGEAVEFVDIAEGLAAAVPSSKPN
jgi:hypothetical protein